MARIGRPRESFDKERSSKYFLLRDGTVLFVDHGRVYVQIVAGGDEFVTSGLKSEGTASEISRRQSLLPLRQSVRDASKLKGSDDAGVAVDVSKLGR